MLGEISPRIRSNSSQLGNVKSTVYASATLGAGSANVSQGSSKYGPDMTAGLQALLTAGAGGTVVIDGQYMTLGSLGVPSSTTVIFPKGCGLIHGPGATGSMMYNAGMISGGAMVAHARGTGGVSSSTAGASTPAVLGNYVNTNIKVVGGILNGNFQAQTGNQNDAVFSYWTVMQWFGVNGLRLEDVTVYDSSNYGIWFCNCRNFSGANLSVDMTNNYGDGDDCFHINGPCQYGQFRNIRTNGFDNNFAINADDGFLPGQPFPWPGSITDILVDGWFMDANVNSAARILSDSQMVDRIIIRNVTGSVGVGGAVCMDPDMVNGTNVPPRYQLATFGPGNFGSVLLENWLISTTATGGPFNPESNGYFYLNGTGGNVTLRNVKLISPTSMTKPLVYVDNVYAGAHYVRQLTMENVEYQEIATTGNVQPLLYMAGRVKNVSMRHCLQERASTLAIADSPLVKVVGFNSSLTCDSLILDDCYTDNVNSMVEITSGRVGSLKLSGYHHNSGTHNAVTIASGGTVDNFNSINLDSDVSTHVSSSGTVTVNIDSSGVSAFAIRSGVPNLWDGLLAYWRMAETSGTTVTDQLGNYNLTAAATISNGASFGSLTTSQFGTAQLYLSGDTGSGTIARLCQAAQFPQPSTVMGWVNFSNVATFQVVAIRGRATAATNWIALYLTAAGKLEANSGSANQFTVQSSAISASTWYHVAMVTDPYGQLGTYGTPVMYLYVNGSLVGSNTWAAPVSPNPLDAFALGGASNSTSGSPVSPMIGTPLITNWGVWAVPLSAAQISLAYNGGTGVSLV